MQLKRIFLASLTMVLMSGCLYPSTFISNVKAASLQEELVILFDEGHGQWFNASRMQTVMVMLNISEGRSVYVNKSPFNATNLIGVDVLIITNPGNESTFTRDEAFYLRQYLKRGGGLFLLSNPYNTNETLTGNPNTLNLMLTLTDDADLPLEKIEFLERVNQTADIIMDDYHNLNGERSLLDLSETNFTNTTVISTQPTNISRILVHSQSITAPLRIGKAYLESYTEDAEHEVYLAEETPLWLGSTNQSEAWVVICGSSIMFSDLLIPGTNETWASHPDFNNTHLFNNTINWIANITPTEKVVISEPFDSPLPLFMTGATILFVVGVIILYMSTPEKEVPPITETIRDLRTRDKKKIKPKKRM
ncbi:MAG: hypothetical protein ACE5R6_01255 [Candidatus Heimdallarchaeota archaeon]